MADDQRPDGATATAIGWLLVVVGIVAAFITANAETTNGWIFGIAIANLGLGLGVLLLSLGYLVRAIWFLPGREIQASDSIGAPAEPARTCEWCGRTPMGGKPCSNFPAEGLERLAGKVTDTVCKRQLQERGYGVGVAQA